MVRAATFGEMRALLSVYDKTGIAEFAAALDALGWTLISSGGTAAAIAAAGVAVTDVADLTGVPAILGHRVVTLHPSVHGGILADTDDAAHRDDMRRHGIEPIDLVVVGLYPFEDQPSIEQIDIGGPTLVRAAAKNHARVGVVVDAAQYPTVLDELRRDGALGPDTRRRLAAEAFRRIAEYDEAIAHWFTGESPDTVLPDAGLPEVLDLRLERAQSLRYGENPHQHGARYRLRGAASWWDTARQWGGKELSYLNVFDTEAAWALVHRFEQPSCVIVKHANPCGVAQSHDIATAYRLANDADPVSAFGGIVALNRTVTAELVEDLGAVFTEVVVAPDYAPDALELLARKPNLRVLSGPSPAGAALDARSIDARSIDGGFLVQTTDVVSTARDQWRVVTDTSPTDAQWRDLEFAWQVCAAVSSNAIVLAEGGRTVGIGGGQPNRVDSARIAVGRAAGRAAGGVCASDAFFPFSDTLDAVVVAGVAAVIQPGGSVRDQESIDAANRAGVAMVFTGQRHFRH